MKTMLAGLKSLVLLVTLSGSALAQEEIAPEAQPMQPGPGPSVAPASAPGVYTYPTGRWIYTADNRWVWIPAGATSVAIGGAPHVYLYAPGHGWAWRVSPWGWGGYRYGAWVGHPWRSQGWRGGRGAYPHAVGRGGWGHYGHRR